MSEKAKRNKRWKRLAQKKTLYARQKNVSNHKHTPRDGVWKRRSRSYCFQFQMTLRHLNETTNVEPLGGIDSFMKGKKNSFCFTKFLRNLLRIL